MSDEDIVKVVNKLVGEINPIADSSYDLKILNNIMLMGSVIDTLVCNIGNVMYSNRDSQFASIQECTLKGKEILTTINANINEYLKECAE